LLAAAYDLKLFFIEVDQERGQVSAADVLAFIAAQRAPRSGPKVVRP
jgi:integrase/recombinase XerD